VTVLPASSLLLPRLNQNLEVIAGSTKSLEYLLDGAANQHLGLRGDWGVAHRALHFSVDHMQPFGCS